VAELKVACAAHKLVLDKKAARVDIIDIIMKQKIYMVSGFVYNGLSNNYTLQDIKKILKKQNLPISGSKEELLYRLLISQGGAAPTQNMIQTSNVAPKAKKRKLSYGFNDSCFNHDELSMDWNLPTPKRFFRGLDTLPSLKADNSRLCAGYKCSNKFAFNCIQDKCGVCCSGPCLRHGKL